MNVPKALSVSLLAASAVTLIALQLHPLGWIMLLLSTISLLLAEWKLAKDLLLVNLSLGILGLTPITTDISYGHIFKMGTALTLVVTLPYLISRFVYKDHHIRFPFHHGRSWYRTEVAYIGLTAIVSYILLPFYMSNTGAYLNWPSYTDASHLVRFFIGTNALGIWDELFFVCTVLGLVRWHLRFWLANLFQATLFASFLYELGFRGWGPCMIFGFALLQGYIFKKTESLLYVITIHLTLDFILFLAIIHAYHPDLIPIFLVS